MKVQDLTVEVRNGSYQRVGQLLPADLNGLTVIMRYNNVGTWSISLPSDHRLVDALRAAGAGIIVGVEGKIIFSGYTTTATLQQSKDNPLGDWLIEGVDDSVILSERLAYPLPSQADVTLQTVVADVRTGNAETVIKGYVQDNISALAGTIRAINNLVIEENLSRGSVVTGSARFVSLQELIYGLAQTGGIGFTIKQIDADLEFQVFEPVDRSLSVRMDVDNGKLTSTEYAYGQPKLTRVIVGGNGEAEDRVFYEGSNADSLAAENLWSRRVEKFIDSRGSGETNELEQSAAEALVDEGKTIVNLSVTPSDDQTMRFGFDWYLGDKITVVVGLVESTSIVTEVGLSVSPDGVRIGATVGTPVAVDFESKLIAAATSQESRISNLERNKLEANLVGIDSITTLDWAQFDTTYAGGSIAPGMLTWNNTDGTLEFRLKGNNVTLQIGQEQNVRVRNNTAADFIDGQVVYASGSIGTFQTAALASSTNEAGSSVTLGMVTEPIAKNTEGFVTTFGLVRNLDTSALTEGEIVWLGETPGTVTTTKPIAPVHAVQVGLCIRSHPNLGVIFVKVQNGYELDELHNVKITSPTDGQFLKYQASTGLWINSN